MPIVKRRSRLVTFRVSADEYRELSESCLQTGARSIADFSRSAVLETVQNSRRRPGTLSGDLATLSRSLGDLDFLLIEARKRIRSVLGGVSTEDAGATR